MLLIMAVFDYTLIKTYWKAGWVYIGASGSMARGLKMPGGPLESKRSKFGKLVLLNLWSSRHRLGIREMLWGPTL